MKQIPAPLRCYEATVTQGGRSVTIVHRCGDADCPDNK